MASIPGFRFDITGASGSQGLLSPQNAWRAYILPRGAHAAQDSTGTTITFDSNAAAARFAALDWVQVGTGIANIRQVQSVSTNTIVVDTAVTVSENDRVFLIGTTQPTTTGGSATYTTPATTIYKRDDDGAATYTNSMITSDANGLIQGFAVENFYDCLIQDSNQSNQGSVIDLTAGAVEGISTSGNATFGLSVTITGGLSVSNLSIFGDQTVFGKTISIVGTSGNYAHVGTALFGQTVTVNGAFGVTGTAVFGQTISVVGTSGNYYHTGTAKFGNTVTFEGAIGVTGWATFGSSATFNAAIGVTGTATFGDTATFNGPVVIGTTATTYFGRINRVEGTSLSPSGVSLTAGWTPSGATLTITPSSNDQRGMIQIQNAGTGTGPSVVLTYTDGPWGNTTFVSLTRSDTSSPNDKQWSVVGQTANSFEAYFQGTVVAGSTYGFVYHVLG